eukprot:TRINITY_DN3143_c0_g1_i1.p1 TRINITY_DN3143_c0_g1~~TRINITY_DN3143_c0_g1_i1.p1  ORF type:complete len:297 (+),score=60.31 TRINITY_DN3143_c0_g1_i1:96-986(+)
MELRVASSAGHTLPQGCVVGVRVGEVLKQGRYEPQRSYYFPQGGRNAKIDIYQHIGTCTVPVDAESQPNQEVSVTSTDPSFPSTKLNVSVQAKSDYLAKHRIEERLSEAVKALLKDQPGDPTKFLCTFLAESQPPAQEKAPQARPKETEKPPEKAPQAQKSQPAPPQASAKQKESRKSDPKVAQKPQEKPAEVAQKPQEKPAEVAQKPQEKPAEAEQSSPSSTQQAAASTAATSQATTQAPTPSSTVSSTPAPYPSVPSFVSYSPPHAAPLYAFSNMTACGPAFSSMGLGPGLLFI